MTETLIFASPLMRPAKEEPAAEPWKILVVDDEPDIHAITKIALSDFKLDERGITQLHAYSAKEARNIIEENPDIAMMLLDVVMESDGAGLDLIRYIRKDLGNTAIRIVLRTGNPGHAPERRVIADYDINDYREKSELTTRKLNTVMHTALRSYRDILDMEAEKRQLEHLADTSVQMFTQPNPKDLSAYALEQVFGFVGASDETARQGISAFLATDGETDGEWGVLQAAGNFETLGETVNAQEFQNIGEAEPGHDRPEAHPSALDNRVVIVANDNDGQSYFICLEGVPTVSEGKKTVLTKFLRNFALAFQTLNSIDRPPSADVIRLH